MGGAFFLARTAALFDGELPNAVDVWFRYRRKNAALLNHQHPTTTEPMDLFFYCTALLITVEV
jgi:hypothetical protein